MAERPSKWSLRRTLPAEHAGVWPTFDALLRYIDSKLALISGLTWDAIAGKPATFPPSAHEHPTSDVTGLDAALAALAAADVTLDGDIDALTTVVAGKADAAHAHTTGDITALAEAIDDRVAALLVPGSNITLTYNDGAGTLTIAAAGGGGGGGVAIDPNNRWEFYDDFVGTGFSTNNTHPWDFAVGTGSSFSTATSLTTPRHPGIFRFTTTTSYATALLGSDFSINGNSTIALDGTDAVVNEWCFKTDANTFPAGASKFLFFGLVDELNGFPSNGVCAFVDSTGLYLRTFAAGAITSTLASAGLPANTFCRVRIEATTGQARLYVNDALVALHAANIPTVGLTLGLVMQEAAKYIDVDYVHAYQIFTGGR